MCHNIEDSHVMDLVPSTHYHLHHCLQHHHLLYYHPQQDHHPHLQHQLALAGAEAHHYHLHNCKALFQYSMLYTTTLLIINTVLL